jgi:hypothetical protein
MLMTATLATVTADSRLSTDYLLAANILVDVGATSPLSTLVLPDGTVTALAVLPDLGLTHITPDSSSASGWKLTPMPQGTGVQEAVGGVHSDNLVHAYYQNGTNTLHSVLSNGAWSQPDVLTLATGLGALTTAESALSVMGASSDGNLVIFAPGFSPESDTFFKGALLGAQLLPAVSQDSTIYTLGAVVGGRLTIYFQTFLSPGTWVPVVVAEKGAARVHYVNLTGTTVTTLYSDTQNLLWFGSFPMPNAKGSAVLSSVTGSSVKQGVGLVGSDTLIRFFAVDPDGTMWILNQLDWNSDGTPDWAPFFPLDVNVSFLSTPPDIQDDATLLAIGADQTLHVLTQDATTQLWTRNLILSPNPDTPLELVRYRTELLLSDSNGTPMPGSQVTLSSSLEVAIQSQGVTSFVGPDPAQAVTLTADALGKVTFSYPATELSAPVFTVTAPGTALTVTVTPHQYLHDFLSGQASINTGSTTISPLSSDVLASAQVDGQPLVPSSVSSDTVNAVVSGIQDVMGMSTVSGGASTLLRNARRVGSALDLRDPKNPRVMTFSSAAELEAHRARVTQELSLGSIWSDIADFFGDIWRAIKTGAMAVVQWIVDATTNAIQFVVNVGEEVSQLVQLAVTGVEDAVSAVHTFLLAVGADIEKALDWLKDLFSWADIWNTKQVFEHFILQLQPAIEWVLQQEVKPAVQKVFTGFQDAVDSAFSTAISQFSGQSVAAVISPSDPSQASTGNTLAASVQPQGSSSAQSSWFTSKVSENLPSGVESLLGGSTLSSDLVAALWDVVTSQTIAQDFDAAVSSLKSFFSDVFNSPSQFSSLGMADLLGALKALVDLFIQVVDGLVTALLNLLANGVGDIWAMLTTALPEIPIVTWLWNNVIASADEPMTIVALGSLVLAFPVTILFKLANSQTPPFDDTTTQQILSTNFQAPQQQSVATTLAFQGFALDEAVRKQLIVIVSVFQGLADVLLDLFASADSEEMLPKASTSTLVMGVADLVVNFVLQVLSWPTGNILNFDYSGFTTAQIFSLANWFMGWIPLLLNAFLMRSPDSAQVAESIDAGGKVFLTFWGAGMFAAGSIGAVGGNADDPPTANGYDIGASYLAPLPNLMQFLRLNSTETETVGGSLAAKVLINLFGDIGAGALQLKGV